MKRIGFIGLGNMGRGMCNNIIKKGYPLTVYDKNPAAAEYFRGRALAASSPAEVLENSEVVLLSLPNSDIVERIVGEFLEQDVSGKTVIDLSTSYPESTKMLYEKFKKCNGSYIDAPLLGGPANTEEGNAPCMVAGDKQDVDSVMDILACFASPINYFGPSGSAHTVKIAMNFTGIAYGVVVSQMFPLMEKMGIDTKNLFDIMKEGSHGSGHFRIYGKKCVEKDYYLAFALELALKDLVYMKRLYEKYNVPAFVLDGALDLLRQAVKEGRGKHDVTEISAVMYEYLGLDTGEKN